MQKNETYVVNDALLASVRDLAAIVARKEMLDAFIVEYAKAKADGSLKKPGALDAWNRITMALAINTEVSLTPKEDNE